MYAERGASVRVNLSQPPAVLRLSLNGHDESSEMPTTSSKTALSRCQPIGVPGLYSFSYENVRKIGRFKAGKRGCFFLYIQQKRRYRLGMVQRPVCKTIVPAERNGSAFAEITVKFKFL